MQVAKDNPVNATVCFDVELATIIVIVKTMKVVMTRGDNLFKWQDIPVKVNIWILSMCQSKTNNLYVHYNIQFSTVTFKI